MKEQVKDERFKGGLKINKNVEKRKAIGKQPFGTYKFVPKEVV